MKMSCSALRFRRRKSKSGRTCECLLQEYGLWNFRSQSHPSQLSPAGCGSALRPITYPRTGAFLLLLDRTLQLHSTSRPDFPSATISGKSCKEGKCTFDTRYPRSASACLIGSSSSRKSPHCVGARFYFYCSCSRTPIQMQNAPEFKQYFQQIWKELNHDT